LKINPALKKTDTFFQFVENECSHMQNRKYLLLLVCLTIANVTIFSLFPMDHRPAYDRFRESISAFILGVAAIGFGLGLVAALFPLKDLSFPQRYLRASLLCMLGLQLILLVWALVEIVRIQVAG
jgi:uncharacterized membrane protein YsdA (DUF1294 family)